MRDLARVAYERELEAGLEQLREPFHAWENGDMDASELSLRISFFSIDAQKRIEGVYSGLDKRTLVARGVGLGLLEEADLPPKLKEELTGAIDFFRSQSQREAEEDAAKKGSGA